MIWSSRARNRSADPVVSCFFGRIALSNAATESCFSIRGNRENEIASFQGLRHGNLAISSQQSRQKKTLAQWVRNSSRATKEARTLLDKASEMFEETGCVPGSDGEEVPAETMVPDAKEYILETINDPEASYDPEIWDTPGFTLVLSWLAQKWQQKCRKLAPRGGNKNAVQYLTKEQQKSCLDSAAAELIREIKQQRPLN